MGEGLLLLIIDLEVERERERDRDRDRDLDMGPFVDRIKLFPEVFNSTPTFTELCFSSFLIVLIFPSFSELQKDVPSHKSEGGGGGHSGS